MPKCHSRALDGGHVVLRHINSGILPEYKMLWTIIVQLCNFVSVQLLYSSAFSSPADPMPFKHCWWNSHGTSSVISIIHLFLSQISVLKIIWQGSSSGSGLPFFLIFRCSCTSSAFLDALFKLELLAGLSWKPEHSTLWSFFPGGGELSLVSEGNQEKINQTQKGWTVQLGPFFPTEQLKYNFKKD